MKRDYYTATSLLVVVAVVFFYGFCNNATTGL